MARKAKRLSAWLNDSYKGAYATVGAADIAEALRVVPPPGPVRTLADMSVDEKRGLERLYGVRICGSFDRLKKY